MPIGAWLSLPLPKLSDTCRCTTRSASASHASNTSTPATAKWLVSNTTWRNAASSAGVTTDEKEAPATGNRFSIAKRLPAASASASTSSASQLRAEPSQRKGAWATIVSAPTAAASSRLRRVLST